MRHNREQRERALLREASELYDAATDFIRIYQFRDRNQGLDRGLTVVQAYTLDILVKRKGQALLELARALYLDKSTTSRIVAGMARLGLVEWFRPLNDQRVKRIEASVEGKRRYTRFRNAIVRDNARLLASYSSAARREAIKMLCDLAKRARPDPKT